MQNVEGDPFGIVGQVLDAQFRVDGIVGEGGFSAVYRGYHLGLREPIAIKCLKLPPTVSPALVGQFEERFRDESRILYRLSQGNLNIVRSIAAGTWQAPTGLLVPYMVLEWLEGRSLASDLALRRTAGQAGRSLSEVVKLFGPAADGLGYAHGQGVVHRDLNPGNLFLASTPQGPRLKVLDFGVAKILDDSTLDIAHVQTVGQLRIFAPAYGAPEQFDDAIGEVSAASDVYAFALVLLEALCDRPVNDGEHLGDFARRATDPTRRPTPRALGMDVSDEVEQIFTRATRLDPRERWQSVGELWQGLAVASSAASQQKHAQAAKETQALAMPRSNPRKTQIGLPPPRNAPAGSVAPLGATAPLGALAPNLKQAAPPGVRHATSAAVAAAGARSPSTPGVGAPSSRPVQLASAPRVAAPRPGAPQPAARRSALPSVADEDVDAEPTRVGSSPNVAAAVEVEDEVTRVHAHGADFLRGLSGTDRAAPPAGVTQTQRSAGNPPPAAGAPVVPAAGGPAPSVEGGLPALPGAPMMASQLAMTMPLNGPHPLDLPGQPPRMGGLPPSGGIAPPAAPPFDASAQYHPEPPPAALGMAAPFDASAQYHPEPPPAALGMAAQPSPAQPVYGSTPYAPMAPGAPYPQSPAYGPFGYVPGEGAPAPMQPMAPPRGTQKKGPGLVIALISVAVLFVVVGSGAAFFALRAKAHPVTSEPPPEAPVAAAATEVAPSIDTSPAPVAPPPVAEPVEPAAEPAAEAPAATQAEDPAPAAPEPEAPAAPQAGAPQAAPTPEPRAAAVQATPTPLPVHKEPAPTALHGPAHAAATAKPAAATAKPAAVDVDPNAFNEAAARSKLGQANSILVFCKKEGGVTGPGAAMVTFAPDGSVSAVAMEPPYAGTPAGDCVTGHFKRTKVSSFTGSPHTIKHTFTVPK